MDTYLNNDASLTQDEGATFGEYRTTTKVNGVQSEYTPDIDAIPSAEAEYGGHISAANELVGADTNFDTNFDVLQVARAGANDTAETNPFGTASSTVERGITLGNITDDGGAQFGEYRTTTKVNGVESIYTPNVDAIPSAEDLIGKNDFTSSTPIVDANISESTPLVDAASGLNLGETTTSNNYNVTESELVDTNGNKANDEDLENFNVFNSNDNLANEAINDIKQNLQVYDGVLHHSIEPVVDSNDYNVNENQTEQLNDGNDNYSYIIDTATLNDNYQSVEPTPIIDTDALNENYQTTEPTPIIDTDAAANNNQNIEPNTIVDTSDAPEDSLSYDSGNPEIDDTPNVDTQIIDSTANEYQTTEPIVDATENVNQVANEAQTSNPIIEDYNPIFTTTPAQIIDLTNGQEATQNFETTVTENENVFESKTPMVTPPVENINVASGLATSDTTYNLQTNNNLTTTDYSTTNTGADLTNVQTTDNFDYNKFLGNYQVTQSTGSELKPSQNILQTRAELTTPADYTAYTQTTPVTNYESAIASNELSKVQPTTTTTTTYTQAAPLAAIPKTNLTTITTTNIPAQYTQTTPFTATESIIKPTTIPKDKPTTNTGTYTPAKYTVYSQKNAKTTFEPVIKPPEIPTINSTSTITTTNTPPGYAKYFETTPVTMKPTTTTTTFTTTPTQNTTYSETVTMKPTTTTTTFTSTPPGYAKYFETTPATVTPTTTSTTFTNIPAQYTTYSETTPVTTTTTFTNTPAQYTTYSETTPVTVKPTTTTFTTTPAQYTTYSETVTMKPTTTTTTFTTTPAQYTTYSQTTPITTQSTTFTSPVQYTTYSETTHMPITTSSVSIPRVEQYTPIETLYTPTTTITRNIVPQNISVVPQPILPPKPQPITVTVPKIQKVFVPKIKKVYVPSQKKIYVRTPSAGSIMIPSTGSHRAITTAMPTPAPIVPMAVSPQVIPTSQTLPFNSVPIVSTVPTVKSPVAGIQGSYMVPTAPTLSQLPIANSILNPAGLPANGMLIQSQPGLVNLPYSQRSYSMPRSRLANVPYSQRSYRVPQTGLVNIPYSQGSFAMTQPRLANLPYSQGSARLLNVPYGQGSVMLPQQVPYSQASFPVAQANYGQRSIPISNYSQSTYPGLRRPNLYSTSSNRSTKSNRSGYGNYRTRSNVVNPYSAAGAKYTTRTYNARRL